MTSTRSIDQSQILGRAGLIGPAYLGQVATRCDTPTAAFPGGYVSGNFQTQHVARDRIAALQVAWANWRIDNPSQQELGSGGTAKYRAAVQYPIGSAWQPLTWGGARDVTVTDRATSPLCDALTLATPIPEGAAFRLRVHVEAASVLLVTYQGASVNDPAWGTGSDFAQSANGVPDRTTDGSAIPASGWLYNPLLIVAQTRRPSVICIGDSRVRGLTDTIDGTGAVGIFARSVEPHFGHLNVGIGGEQGASFLGANGARRRALLPYFSHALTNYGVNEISYGATAATVLASIANVAATIAPQLAGGAGGPVFHATIEPETSSSDGWTSLASQSVNFSNAGEAARVAVNESLRGGLVAGIAGVLDVAAAVESGLNSGKWAVGPGGGPLVGDGVHESWLGAQVIKRARAVDPTRLRRVAAG